MLQKTKLGNEIDNDGVWVRGLTVLIIKNLSKEMIDELKFEHREIQRLKIWRMGT